MYACEYALTIAINYIYIYFNFPLVARTWFRSVPQNTNSPEKQYTPASPVPNYGPANEIQITQIEICLKLSQFVFKNIRF